MMEWDRIRMGLDGADYGTYLVFLDNAWNPFLCCMPRAFTQR